MQTCIASNYERALANGIGAFVVCLLGLFGSNSLIAQVPVEDSMLRAAAQLDSRSFNTPENDDLWARAGQEAGSGLPANASDQPLFYQIQVLQQELRELRGLLEEQTYVIQKLQQDQRLQYVDLDRRVAALAPNRPAPGPMPLPSQEPQSDSQEPADGFQSALPDLSEKQSQASAAKPATEREAYAQAIEWMRAKQFEDSAGAFDQLIIDYPNGQYTPNAFYWLGELNLATGETEVARQNFVQVIRLYPDHQKVPDSLYKLGVLYAQLGDEAEARRYLQQVQSEHPQSSAGALAKRYLAEME